MLDELKSGERSEITVPKDIFLSVRDVLVNRPDFKHFRGIAKHNGLTIYRYSESARS